MAADKQEGPRISARSLIMWLLKEVWLGFLRRPVVFITFLPPLQRPVGNSQRWIRYNLRDSWLREQLAKKLLINAEAHKGSRQWMDQFRREERQARFQAEAAVRIWKTRSLQLKALSRMVGDDAPDLDRGTAMVQ